jgi:hypothetical protein
MLTVIGVAMALSKNWIAAWTAAMNPGGASATLASNVAMICTN